MLVFRGRRHIPECAQSMLTRLNQEEKALAHNSHPTVVGHQSISLTGKLVSDNIYRTAMGILTSTTWSDSLCATSEHCSC
jgi:hypothetical protein